ncbi:hypothetical protein K1719_014863 [Acacia pycnantha]|nr:hypothetical protein K1719_014863 [Acacia pycnantha]
MLNSKKVKGQKVRPRRFERENDEGAMEFPNCHLQFSFLLLQFAPNGGTGECGNGFDRPERKRGFGLRIANPKIKSRYVAFRILKIPVFESVEVPGTIDKTKGVGCNAGKVSVPRVGDKHGGEGRRAAMIRDCGPRPQRCSLICKSKGMAANEDIDMPILKPQPSQTDELWKQDMQRNQSQLDVLQENVMEVQTRSHKQDLVFHKGNTRPHPIELTRIRLKEMELPDSILALEGNLTLPAHLREEEQIAFFDIVIDISIDMLVGCTRMCTKDPDICHAPQLQRRKPVSIEFGKSIP